MLPSVGPLVARQVLVVSRTHVPSLAAMGKNGVGEYDAFVHWLLGEDREWLEAEHGATEEDCAGACVTHVHVHLIPGMAEFAEVFDGVYPELFRGNQLILPGPEVPHVFLRGGLGQTRVFQAGGLLSQVLRQGICAIGILVEVCALSQIMQRLGLAELRVAFRSTGRNQPVKNYLSAKFAFQDDGYVIPRSALPPTPHIQSS